MKIHDLLEAKEKLFKSGQKIRITKDTPAFGDVPTASAQRGESNYSYSFKKGDELIVSSCGDAWVTVAPTFEREASNPGKNKDRTFNVQRYRWRLATDKFDSSWYELVDVTFPEIITDEAQANEWMKINGNTPQLKSNGDGTFTTAAPGRPNTVTLKMRSDTRLRLKFRDVDYIVVDKPIENLKDLPQDIKALFVKLGKGNKLEDLPKNLKTLSITGDTAPPITDMSSFPEFPNLESMLFYEQKKVESLKDFKKKFPKVTSLALTRLPALKRGFLDVAHITTINGDGTGDLAKVFSILRKNAGQGKIKLQRALLDNDLDDFE